MFCSTRVVGILPLWILMLVSASEISGAEGHLELIFSDRSSLRKVDLETGGSGSVIVSGLSNAVALDYHYEKKLVVWSDVRNKGIFSANIDAGIPKVLATDGVVTPDGLSVDWIHGNIYWTDTGTNTISVMSLDGKMKKLLFGTDLDEPRAIVVDPMEGWMYWTDWGDDAKIERSGMDGTLRSTIVSEAISIPNGLAIDFESRKLFWADVQSHSIRSCDYDGSNIKNVFTSLTKVGHPFAVDVYKEWVYWTDWRTHSVSKVKIVNQQLDSISSGVHFFPMGVRIYHREKQPKGRKYCGEKDAECQYLCLPTPKGTGRSTNFTCACPDKTDCSTKGTVASKSFSTLQDPTTAEKSISTTNTFATTTSTIVASLTAAPSQSKLQSYSLDTVLQEMHENIRYYGRFSGFIFGLLVILIVVMILVGFSIHKQCLRGTITGLSFVNPVFRKQTTDNNQDPRISSEAGFDHLI